MEPLSREELIGLLKSLDLKLQRNRARLHGLPNGPYAIQVSWPYCDARTWERLQLTLTESN